MKDSSLAAWLKRKKDETNWSQRKIASKAHIATGTVSNILDGHIPGVDIIQQLAKVFGDNPETVLEIAGIVQLSDVPADAAFQEKNTIRRIRQFPPEDQQWAWEQIEATLRFVEAKQAKANSNRSPANPPTDQAS